MGLTVVRFRIEKLLKLLANPGARVVQSSVLSTPGRAVSTIDPPGCATLTESSRRALSILHPDYPLAPAIFAHYMWPTSESWVQERDAVREIRLKAGLLLANLERDGLARYCGAGTNSVGGYVLTSWGEHAADPPARPDRLL